MYVFNTGMMYVFNISYIVKIHVAIIATTITHAINIDTLPGRCNCTNLTWVESYIFI